MSWTYYSKRTGFKKEDPEIWAYPEIDGMSCVQDLAADASGEDQLDYYVSWILDHKRDSWDKDRVLICWTIMPAWEFAPVRFWRQDELMCTTDMERDFTIPRNDKGDKLDWFKLPVRYSRFPALGAAIGWKPSLFQPYAPLRSIMHSRWDAE